MSTITQFKGTLYSGAALYIIKTELFYLVYHEIALKILLSNIIE